MKKQVVILSLILVSHFVYAQEMDTIYNFPHYEVINGSMQAALDKAIDTARNCPYFKLLNKKFYIIVDMDSNKCSFRVYPHTVSMICFYKYDMKKWYIRDGLCYYKGCYVYLIDHSSKSVMNNFFASSHSTVNMFLEKNPNIVETRTPFDYFCILHYQIKDYSLIRQYCEEDDDNEGNGKNWLKNRYFHYLVQNGDTWETIASRCGCTKESIQKEYPDYERPIPGLLLLLRYVFDDNGNFQGMIQWYK